MIVCICLALSDRAIQASIVGGALTVDAVAAACRAGTGCGACVPMLQRMIEDAGWSSPPDTHDYCRATEGPVTPGGDAGRVSPEPRVGEAA
jgi:bacterioferritin-associated ferredoxin